MYATTLSVAGCTACGDFSRSTPSFGAVISTGGAADVLGLPVTLQYLGQNRGGPHVVELSLHYDVKGPRRLDVADRAISWIADDLEAQGYVLASSREALVQDFVAEGSVIVEIRPKEDPAPAGRMQADGTVRLPDGAQRHLGATDGELVFFVCETDKEGYVTLMSEAAMGRYLEGNGP